MMKQKIVAAALLLLCCSAAGAWYTSGQRIIADMTWLQLEPRTRSAAARLLREHPDYEQGFARHLANSYPAELEPRWRFRQAAAWPDLAKLYRAGDSERHRRFSRPRWHYINQPLWPDEGSRERLADGIGPDPKLEPQDPGDETMNVVQAIRANLALVKSEAIPAEDRALALSWLLHLVPDLHQPLHAVAMFGLPGMEQSGDRGGNRICLRGRDKPENLHAFWDSLLAPGPISNGAVETKALEMLIRHRDHVLPAVSGLDTTQWVSESRAVAGEWAYNPELVEAVRTSLDGSPCRPGSDYGIELPEDYIANARMVAERQAVLASIRLARLLETVFR